MHVEERFEEAIEASMLAAGWRKGSPHDYRPSLGLDVEQLFAFIHATQPTAWARILGYYGGDEATGRAKFAQHLGMACGVKWARPAHGAAVVRRSGRHGGVKEQGRCWVSTPARPDGSASRSATPGPPA